MADDLCRGFRGVGPFAGPGNDVVCVVLSLGLDDHDRPIAGGNDA